MGSQLAPIITDAAETALDIARVAHVGGPLEDTSMALKEKRDDLKEQKLLVEAQIAEIEKFHQQVTGKVMKEAAIRALTWHL
jgi:hypothetical protein